MKNKIKRFIFEQPEEWKHIREVARRLKISPNTVRKVILELSSENIIEKRKKGNMLQVRANFEKTNYKDEKRIQNISDIYKSGIIDYLYNFYNPDAIVLFGSYSRGEDISNSDIDIGIITSNKKRPDLKKFEKKLKRIIQLSLFTRKEVSTEFFNNIINGIVLKGVLK